MNIDPQTLKSLVIAADRSAIQNVLGTYCRALDRLDLELLKNVYHPDGFDDHGSMKLNTHEFAEKIIERIRSTTIYGMHTITQTVIEVEGDRATSEAYYLGLHRIAPGEASIGQFFGPKYLNEARQRGTLDRCHEYLCGGRYLDVLHKRAGAWRIYRRRMTNEFTICRPESPCEEGTPAAFFTGSYRDRQDPLYAFALE